MDFHPPQGAHTSYLRTLSMIISLRGVPAPLGHFVRGSRTSYIEFLIRQHPGATFLLPAIRLRPDRASSGDLVGLCRSGPRIIHPTALPSSPRAKNLSSWSRPVLGDLALGTGPFGEGARIIHPVPVSSSPGNSRGLPCFGPPPRRAVVAAMRRAAHPTTDSVSVKPPAPCRGREAARAGRIRPEPAARARSCACRSAAGVRHPRRRRARDPPRPRRRCEPRAP